MKVAVSSEFPSWDSVCKNTGSGAQWSPLPGPGPQGEHQSSGLTEEALTGSTGGLNHFNQNTS
ncbi:hypothetical protein EYF80_025726 [Liparis tanakae]|uniref:Uncharacterized protein n=1 Tax=Liparis tanakae TaxID=230148 RepID=A0A4Z2HGB5_9TELE|nr:hypothetical protein EYF80_025726 [Liparis tanakae]